MRKGFKYLKGYLDGDIRPLVLIMSRMSGCIITFKNNRLIFSRLDNDKLLDKYETTQTLSDDLKYKIYRIICFVII